MNKTTAGPLPCRRKGRSCQSEAGGHLVLAPDRSRPTPERDVDLPDLKEFVSLPERPALPSSGVESGSSNGEGAPLQPGPAPGHGRRPPCRFSLSPDSGHSASGGRDASRA